MLSELSQAAGTEINRANVAAADPNMHCNVAQAKKNLLPHWTCEVDCLREIRYVGYKEHEKGFQHVMVSATYRTHWRSCFWQIQCCFTSYYQCAPCRECCPELLSRASAKTTHNLQTHTHTHTYKLNQHLVWPSFAFKAAFALGALAYSI